MTKYRVTYVDSVLRETVVEASTPEQAEDKARQEIDSAVHHHTADAWQDDWQAEPYKRPPVVNATCWECGERRP